MNRRNALKLLGAFPLAAALPAAIIPAAPLPMTPEMDLLAVVEQAANRALMEAWDSQAVWCTIGLDVRKESITAVRISNESQLLERAFNLNSRSSGEVNVSPTG